MRRAKCKIARLIFYSHGIVNEILPWLKGVSKGHTFDRSVAAKLNKDSFTDDAQIYSFACRTRLGNPEIDETVYR